jgi:hypothetical protein
VQFLRNRSFPLRSAVSAGAAISAVIGLVVGVQLASSGSQELTPAVDKGGNPIPTRDQQGGDLPPMDGMPMTVIVSTVEVNGTPTVKTITVSKPPAPTSSSSPQQQDQTDAHLTTTALPTTTTPKTSAPATTDSTTSVVQTTTGQSAPPPPEHRNP